MIDDHAPTEIRPRYPLPPAPARHLPVRQPPIRYAPGVVVGEHEAAFHSAATILVSGPHTVDVRPDTRPARHPRHAHVEDVEAPSWWAREWTHILAGLVGGALLLVLAAVVYVVGAVLG